MDLYPLQASASLEKVATRDIYHLQASTPLEKVATSAWRDMWRKLPLMDLYELIAAGGTDDLFMKVAAPRWLKEMRNAGAHILERKPVSDHLMEHVSPFVGSKLRSAEEQLLSHRVMRGKQDMAIRNVEHVIEGTHPMTINNTAYMPKDLMKSLAETGGPSLDPRLSNIYGNAFTHHELAERALNEGVHNTVRKEVVPHLRQQSLSQREYMGSPPTGMNDAQMGRWLDQFIPQHTLGRESIWERYQTAEALRDAVKPLPSVRSSDANYTSRHVASHLGAAPLVAESHILASDPEARNAVMGGMRSDPDNAYVYKKMKQFGGTPNNPIPLGGRQHRAVEKTLVDYHPQAEGAQYGRALSVTNHGAGFENFIQKNAPREVLDHVELLKAVGADPTKYKPPIDYGSTQQHLLPLVGSVRRNS